MIYGGIVNVPFTVTLISVSLVLCLLKYARIVDGSVHHSILFICSLRRL